MTTQGAYNFLLHQLLFISALATVLPAQAEDASGAASVTVGGGLAVGPLYEGSSRYAAFPSLKLKAVLPTQDWGTFTAAFPEGLRWDLPGLSPFGVALLVGYDQGRKERIHTLDGRDDYLKGMGNLDSTALVGGRSLLDPAGRPPVRARPAIDPGPQLRWRTPGAYRLPGSRSRHGVPAVFDLDPGLDAVRHLEQ